VIDVGHTHTHTHTHIHIPVQNVVVDVGQLLLQLGESHCVHEVAVVREHALLLLLCA
jgi:hypothetical protein